MPAAHLGWLTKSPKTLRAKDGTLIELPSMSLASFSPHGFRVVAQGLGLLDHLFLPVGNHRGRDTGLG